MLEGERAQRSEAAREFKQLEKRAAAGRSPALQLASPLPAALAALPMGEADQRRAALERRIAQHSAQVSFGNIMLFTYLLCRSVRLISCAWSPACSLRACAFALGAHIRTTGSGVLSPNAMMLRTRHEDQTTGV